MSTLPEDHTREAPLDRSADRITTLRRTLCLLTLALLGSTWTLWTPQSVFPQVPWLTAVGLWPTFVQWIALTLAVVGLGSALVDREAGRWWRAGLVLFAGAMLVLWLFDQHRLQPWAYQAFLIALVLAAIEPGRGLALLRVFTISIYVFSAVSKLDYTFLHSLGQQFTETLLQLVGTSSKGWSESQRVAAAFAFPLGELAVAVLLAIPYTRRAGLVGAIAMHGLLLLVLGPLGMNQQPAVLVWNVEFIVLAWLLFGGRSKESRRYDEKEGAWVAIAAQPPVAPRTWRSLAVEGLLWMAIFAPLLEPFGWWDHWLAWGLYSPGASRAQVFVRTSDVALLPEGWQPFIADGDETVVWRRFWIDRWSLETLRVPIYPQARFQLGVSIAIANALPAGRDVRVELFSAANRFTGERQQTSLVTRPQLDAAAERFWMNAQPDE